MDSVHSFCFYLVAMNGACVSNSKIGHWSFGASEFFKVAPSKIFKERYRVPDDDVMVL